MISALIRLGGQMPRKSWSIAAMAVLLPAQTLATAELPALSRLEKGRWQLSDPADAKAQFDSVCLGDPMRLIKLEHSDVNCSEEVVASGPNSASIHYICPGRGFGRTNIRVETSRLVKIDTQGRANNRPFAYRVEGRRVGSC
ncbi:hypothetical protein [Sphingosinicella rhizophila]|uniref:DUF3617 family protein n=1 Tax=Sphingosinicella rhizophila TaxID=3050082 RepID=A0ABU3Q8X2_9SPHN|nr:hypothetical protein [Sphingosinicella sp. GR2756]MDT9599849.1 hypothetical protein [Sphingosinicella sp. GR2756]